MPNGGYRFLHWLPPDDGTRKYSFTKKHWVGVFTKCEILHQVGLYREFIWHKGLPGLHNNSQTAAGCCRLWPTLTAGLTSWGWYLLQCIIYCLRQLWNRMPDWLRLKVLCIIGYESAPIHQCRFPGLAISSAKALIYFLYKIYGSTFIKQHTETVMVWNYRKAGCSLRKKFYSVIYYHFWHTVVSYW